MQGTQCHWYLRKLLISAILFSCPWQAAWECFGCAVQQHRVIVQYNTDKLSAHRGGISEVSSFTRCMKSYAERNICDSRLYLLSCFDKFGYITKTGWVSLNTEDMDPYPGWKVPDFLAGKVPFRFTKNSTRWQASSCTRCSRPFFPIPRLRRVIIPKRLCCFQEWPLASIIPEGGSWHVSIFYRHEQLI